jgi:hypothetical protein
VVALSIACAYTIGTTHWNCLSGDHDKNQRKV